MPDRLACDEAMNLSKARLRVQDLDLKNGEVEKTLAGMVPIPWGQQGGFAVVYKFRTQSGKVRALRCYLMPMKADIQFRYERISAYFATCIPEITAGFTFHNEGILIRESVPGQPETKKPFSLIEMEWVEGVTLTEYVASLCQGNDQQGLGQLLQYWVELIQKLRQVNIAHSDLAGGNVMVRPDGRLVLVDYDGVYIPDFQGMAGIVEGQADYQHPEAHLRTFDTEGDNFSALVIYTAILALHLDPTLWTRFTAQNANRTLETNLLFRKSDFLDPESSALFKELEQNNDQRLQTALQELKQDCKQPISQVRPFSALNDPDYQQKMALAKLEQAIHRNDEDEIIQAWIPLLETYGPAQKYRSDLTRAQHMQQKLASFRSILQSGLLQEIADAYTPELAYSRSMTKEERDLLHLTQVFLGAYQRNRDQEILNASETLVRQVTAWPICFTTPQQERIELARQRIAALTTFQQALTTKDIQAILQAYNAQMLNQLDTLTAYEREILQAANAFVQACIIDDDQAVLASSETITQYYTHALIFTLGEEERILLARQRVAALTHFQHALATKRAFDLAAAYTPLLDTFIPAEQILYLQEAYRFIPMYNVIIHALNTDNDSEIEKTYDETLAAQFRDFSSQQVERIEKALRRRRLEEAIQAGNYGQALRLVQEIETTTRQQITDPRLNLVRRKFIRQFEPLNVQGRRINDEVVASIQWPADELVRHAIIVWRTDRWPEHPRKDEPGTLRQIFFRDSHDLRCLARFEATRYMAIYLQVYFAIPDYTQRPPAWFFSDGMEPTSRIAVYYSGSGY